MVDIFDYPVLDEEDFLEDLAEELEGTFMVIAYAGHENNFNFIKGRQQYFRDKYSKYLKHVDSDVGIFHILSAYNTLQDLLKYSKNPQKIRETCENCLNEHIDIGEGPNFGDSPFQEYYNKYHSEE